MQTSKTDPPTPPPDRWQRLTDVFDAALALDPHARGEYLADACADDARLRGDVERLIAAHERAAGGGFIVTSPARRFSAQVRSAERALVGRQLGAYRILHEIGRGGMGAVYLAERSDAQFHKRVAIKLIKRGMDTELVLRRFHAERQILASLDHPNIARLLDGGTTEDGLPYFVMEYIEGEPIDAYVDSNRLSVTRRLELFLQVCSAVAYAHQRLVVHRDIKPLNILVTADGVPKLLDFGIAKLLDADADGLPTVSALRLLTPEYASPEQVEGGHAATTTDVYSLGVVLFELLTGRLPYRVPTRTPESIAHAIRTTEPERPSNTVDERAALTADGTPERMRRRLRGDLDTIVLMALRKEPQRRYASVEQLAADIRRHLAGRPVQARTDTLWYRGTKFVRRNRVSVAAGVLVFIALTAGVAATTWQASVARQQAALAATARARAERRFDDVRKLARSVLYDYHDAIKDLPGATPVRARLVKDGLEYLDRLALEAGGDAALQHELASAYERLGDVQGGTMFANLGDTPGAIASYRKALAILTPLARGAGATPDVRRAVASATQKLGLLLWETGDIDGALAKTRESLAVLDSLRAATPRDPTIIDALDRTLDYVGMILLERGDAAGSLAHHRRSIELWSALSDSVRSGERARRRLSVSLEHAGSALLDLGDLPGALDHNRRALVVREALASEFPLNADYRRTVAVSYYNEGEILARMGRTRAALASYQKDVAIARRMTAADPANEQYRGDLAYGEIRVGDMLLRQGRATDALASYESSRALRAKDVRSDSANLIKRASLIEAHAKTAKALAQLGRRDEALSAVDATTSLMQRTRVAPDNASIRGFFADTYADLGDADATLAARVGAGRDRESLCRSARTLYHAGLAIWSDMMARKILGAGDVAKPQAVEQRMRGCR